MHNSQTMKNEKKLFLEIENSPKKLAAHFKATTSRKLKFSYSYAYNDVDHILNKLENLNV